MKIDPPLVVQVPITSQLSGRLGEIIEERTAGLPPEQRIDVARRTIIEILMTQPAVPLTGLLRRHVAGELERLWISKKELAKIDRKRRLKYLESLFFLAKHWRKNKVWLKAGKAPPQSTALKAITDASRFQSTAALGQFLKRRTEGKEKPATLKRVQTFIKLVRCA
jgi:hypothetical protein